MQQDRRASVRAEIVRQARAQGINFTPEQLEEAVSANLGEQTPQAPDQGRVPPRGVRPPEQIAAENAADPWGQDRGGSLDVLERTGRDIGTGLLRGVTAPGRWVASKFAPENDRLVEEGLESMSGDGMGSRGLAQSNVGQFLQAVVPGAAEMAGQGVIAGPMMARMGQAASGALKYAPGFAEKASKVVGNIGRNTGLVPKYPVSQLSPMAAVRQALPGAMARGTAANVLTNPGGFSDAEGIGANVAFTALDALAAGRLPNRNIAPEGAPKSDNWWNRFTKDPDDVPPDAGGPPVVPPDAPAASTIDAPQSVEVPVVQSATSQPQRPLRPTRPAKEVKGQEQWRQIKDQELLEGVKSGEFDDFAATKNGKDFVEKTSGKGAKVLAGDFSEWSKLSDGYKSSMKQHLHRKRDSAPVAETVVEAEPVISLEEQQRERLVPNRGGRPGAVDPAPKQPPTSINNPDGPKTPLRPGEGVPRVSNFKRQDGSVMSGRQHLINNAPRRNEGGTNVIHWDGIDEKARRQLVTRSQSGPARAWADKFVGKTWQEIMDGPESQKNAVLKAVAEQPDTEAGYQARIAAREAKKLEKTGGVPSKDAPEVVSGNKPMKPRKLTPVREVETELTGEPLAENAGLSPEEISKRALDVGKERANPNAEAAEAAVKGTPAEAPAKAVVAGEYDTWNSSQKRRALKAAGVDEMLYSKSFEDLPGPARVAINKASGAVREATKKVADKGATTTRAGGIRTDGGMETAGRVLRPSRRTGPPE